MPASQWTDALLDQMRETTDPLADEAVAAVYESKARSAVNHLLMELIKNDQAAPISLPEPVRRYLEQSAELPPWADFSRLKLGEDLFQIWGFNSCTILACASLPECYVMKNGIHVLALTQRLEAHTRRRILETAKMIMDVMAPKAFEPRGSGIRAAQRVRLMHASIRFLILESLERAQPGPEQDFATELERYQGWRPEYGQPINQKDLAYTLTTFSHVGIRSLERLGAKLTDDQKDAYTHTWNVAGHLMGIRDELLPVDHQAGARLFETIRQRQAGSTPEAIQMQKALSDFVGGLMPLGLRKLPTFVTRELVGDQTADMLGLEPLNPVQRRVFETVLNGWKRLDEGIDKLYDRLSPARRAAVWLNYKIMHEVGRTPRGWNRELFQLPAELEATLPREWNGDLLSAPEHLLGKLKDAFGKDH